MPSKQIYNKKGGLAVYYKKNLNIEEIDKDDRNIQKLEHTTVRIKNDIIIVATYIKSNEIDEDERVIKPGKQNNDSWRLKCQTQELGNGINNTNSCKLNNYINLTNNILYALDRPTRYSPDGTMKSTIVTSGIPIENLEVHIHLTSDHRPLSFKLGTILEIKPIQKMIKKDYNNTNWPGFKGEIFKNTKIERHIKLIAVLEKTVLTFTEIIKEAIRNNIP